MILRPATFADEKLLLEWRNDPTVREVSSHTAEVSAESHHAWLAKVMNDNDSFLWIAEVDGVPVGQGRIERAWKAISKKMDTCLIGYSIGKEYRGKGYGKQLVELLVKEAQSAGYLTVGARIKRTNERSVIVALRSGIQAIEFF